MKQDVSFDSQGLRIVGHLYTPEKSTSEQRLPAIVISNPAGGVKEQTAGIYARYLSEAGFITLAYDSAYNGESEGTPRGLEDPAHRIEDIKNAVTMLSLHDRVDRERIGLLGICASGGYTVVATATDMRIKAVATVSGVDTGVFFREGYDGRQDPSVLKAMLENAARARTEAAVTGGEIGGFPIHPPNEPAARELGEYHFEGWEYYMTPRASHPRSSKTMPWNSVDKLAGFNSFSFLGAISPRPILFIVGTKAATKWIAERGMKDASNPKELYWIEGASHVDLYDKEEYVPLAVRRLSSYFDQWL
ncbi:hypothetical protein P175DRAFT_0481874 [Aspergillus ochraceoroseus IBT 24754]|uniref:Dienelactone hydrolase domain-containing protein n=2 Tax=Aspergillus ochraceoroseus TaxID=138278 RepID=A0A2T5LS06_9EURO|nr:uncharacterized protein P175DRAFT_0481874 [Aspergillus ochraceoroseus IBT 24754]KKK23517.1 hypothetical protein AOCH_004092 [Aspergillus ochraceoroseus]PTU19063.1 hypothetical protein P175DRAFT_0481874 [Aspergillus ochraceoroseus IBT 24754]